MENGWILQTCANMHKSCENFDKSANEIFEVLRLLEHVFAASFVASDMVMGLDTVLLPVKIGTEKVTIGWDNWSGIFIMADTNDGDAIIVQIYDYFTGSVL